MKITLFILALCAAILGVTAASSADQHFPKGIQILVPKAPVPNAIFLDPKGLPTALSAFLGKTVVLNIWATWCGPCIKELPSLDRLAAKLDARMAIVLAVSQDKGGAAIAKPFLDKIGVQNLPAYADPSGKLWRAMGIRGLPTTFIISQTGVVVGRIEGVLEWDSPEIVRFVSSGLGQ
tara:strand:+ start:25329 stop:25862 length:534 start_codon:yes stop_codon:yes gene_type:complete